jgi:hypothetical protein
LSILRTTNSIPLKRRGVLICSPPNSVRAGGTGLSGAFDGTARKDWTLLIDGLNLGRQPFWAPPGKLVYFLSDRDGYRCIWAQPIDANSRQPSELPSTHTFMQVSIPAALPGPAVRISARWPGGRGRLANAASRNTARDSRAKNSHPG